MRQVHFMYMNKHMELTENHLMEFISTETKMESLQNKTNTVFIPAADIFYGFNTSLTYKILILEWAERFLGLYLQ
jgi:hypothetical protein